MSIQHWKWGAIAVAIPFIFSAVAKADNTICNVTSETELASALSENPTDKEGPCGTDAGRVVSIDASFTVHATITVPNNTFLSGFDSTHPFSYPTLTAVKEFKPSGESQCMIELGKNVFMYNLFITTETMLQAAVCINGDSTLKNITIDGSWVNGFMRGIDVDAAAVLVENNISALNIGILVSKPAAMVRNKIYTKILGAQGIYFQTAPLMTLNNELYGEGGIYFPTTDALKFPLGVAANILKLNTSNQDKTNFHSIYNILPKFLMNCNVPTGYNPYKEDGSCMSYVFSNEVPAVTCPANQIKKTDGSCGCPDGTGADAASGLCIKTVEKLVEKKTALTCPTGTTNKGDYCEKIMEKIVEKPADLSKDGTTPKISPIAPIVANPVSNGCSLVR